MGGALSTDASPGPDTTFKASLRRISFPLRSRYYYAAEAAGLAKDMSAGIDRLATAQRPGMPSVA